MRDLLRMLFETELRLLRARLPRLRLRRRRAYVSPAAVERERLREARERTESERRRRAAEWRDAQLDRPTGRKRGDSVSFGISLIAHGVLLLFLLPVLFPNPDPEEPEVREYSISFLSRPKPEKPPGPKAPTEKKEEPKREAAVEKKPKVEKPEPAEDRQKVEAPKKSDTKPNPVEETPITGLSGGSGAASSALGARSGDHREAIRAYGGSAATEQAVLAGLSWLAAHQDEDGSWSVDEFHQHCRGARCDGSGLREYRVGVTALAVLAFLGAGVDGKAEHEHREVVKKGLRYLVRQQDGDGCLSPRTGNYMYNHGIATLCLAEAALLTQDTKIREATVRALHFTEKAQQPGGGWDYTNVRTLRNDLSVTGWQVMSFYIAKKAELPIDATVERKLERYIKRAVRRDGIGIYADRPPEEGRAGIAMVAVGLLSKLYLGWPPGSRELERAADLLIRERPDPLARSDWRRSFQGTYYWYYGTLALFHMGGDHWEAWNTYLKRDVLPLQKTVGHEKGSWDPDPNWVGAVGGRVTATALSVLIFEVYYRYDPFHRDYGNRSRSRGFSNEK